MAPFITGAIKDATGSYQAPMFVVGALMAVSALVIFAIGAGQGRGGRVAGTRDRRMRSVGRQPVGPADRNFAELK
jgi:hypothetical protein